MKSYMKGNKKNANKLSSVRSTDWKSSLKSSVIVFWPRTKYPLNFIITDSPIINLYVIMNGSRHMMIKGKGGK